MESLCGRGNGDVGRLNSGDRFCGCIVAAAASHDCPSAASAVTSWPRSYDEKTAGKVNRPASSQRCATESLHRITRCIMMTGAFRQKRLRPTRKAQAMLRFSEPRRELEIIGSLTEVNSYLFHGRKKVNANCGPVFIHMLCQRVD